MVYCCILFAAFWLAAWGTVDAVLLSQNLLLTPMDVFFPCMFLIAIVLPLVLDFYGVWYE